MYGATRFVTGRQCLVLVLLLFPARVVPSDEPKTNFERWESEIAAMERRDSEEKPAKGSIVFVGSSSIRLWDLKQSFPELPVVNHGFGGSTVADSVHFLNRLVLPLEPRTIVFYAGDNDIAQGKSPGTVARDFRAFVEGVHAKLPEARIVYLPIKPSPSRENLLEQQREANRLVRELSERDPERLVYVDLVTPMLDDKGRPRPELFVKDQLHLNEQGYALWTKLLAPLLKEK